MSEASEPAAAPSAPPAPPPPAPPLRPWPAFLLDAALGVGLLVALSVLLITPVVLAETFSNPPPRGASGDAVLQAVLPELTVAAIVAMLLAAIALWAIRGRRMPGELPRMPLGRALAWAVPLGIAIQLVVQGIGRVLEVLEVPLAPSNVEPILALYQASATLTWVMVVAVGPFAEELLFRHVLLRRFAVAARPLAGLLATSFLFALMHELGQGAGRSPGEWIGVLGIYAAMGFGFGLVYLRTGRLWAAFAAHAACNATAMAMMAFS